MRRVTEIGSWISQFLNLKRKRGSLSGKTISHSKDLPRLSTKQRLSDLVKPWLSNQKQIMCSQISNREKMLKKWKSSRSIRALASSNLLFRKNRPQINQIRLCLWCLLSPKFKDRRDSLRLWGPFCTIRSMIRPLKVPPTECKSFRQSSL